MYLKTTMYGIPERLYGLGIDNRCSRPQHSCKQPPLLATVRERRQRDQVNREIREIKFKFKFGEATQV